MRGARRAFASRANGRLSKGPKTAAGKEREARAPFRHGLSLPVLLDAALAPDVDWLAREIVSSEPGVPMNETFLALASRVAEAMIDLRRVRLAKRPFSIALDADPTNAATLKALVRLDRYERRALARRKFAIREFAAAKSASPIGGGNYDQLGNFGRRLSDWAGPGKRFRFDALGNFGKRS